jgi:hypothetical protein
MNPDQRKELGQLAAALNCPWAIIDLKPDVHAGITQFEGVDVLDSEPDFVYWFPEAFSSRKSNTHA